MLKIGEMLFCCNTDVIQKFVSFNFYDLLLNANWEKIFCVFACTCMADHSILHERVCYLLYKKMLSYGFMSPIRYYNNQHVIIMWKLYECTKFGTNIVGEMCTNSVTWYCAYLCKTEDTMIYACCNIWCTTCSLLWPLSANISKSAQVFIFCF